jgi:hypothetical protein
MHCWLAGCAVVVVPIIAVVACQQIVTEQLLQQQVPFWCMHQRTPTPVSACLLVNPATPKEGELFTAATLSERPGRSRGNTKASIRS